MRPFLCPQLPALFVTFYIHLFCGEGNDSNIYGISSITIPYAHVVKKCSPIFDLGAPLVGPCKYSKYSVSISNSGPALRLNSFATKLWSLGKTLRCNGKFANENTDQELHNLKLFLLPKSL